MSELTYFAAKPLSELGDELIAKKDEYYRYLNNIGRRELLFNCYNTYYKPALTRGYTYRSGVEGELVNLTDNHFRSLIDIRLIMATGQRPAFEPKAINTDAESGAQVKLASGLLEYYERVKKLERYLTKATGFAITYGEGFVGTFWNATRGEVYARSEDGKPIYEGDLEFGAYHSFDVIRSTDVLDPECHNWYMLRTYVNKFDYASKYPELKDRIIGLSRDISDDAFITTFAYNYNEPRNEDVIPLYTFFHKRTEALPEGRLVEFSSPDTMYSDGPLPYKELPLYRIAPSEMEGQLNGYTNAFDLLPLQETLDKLVSTVTTNQAAFGIQNIAVPKGSGINVLNLRGGLNIVEYDAKMGKPEALQLTATPPEIFQFIHDIKKDMETLIGVNSVARGNPESSLKSGAALALIQSLAIQFAQGLQQSYAHLLEDVGTSIINILQTFADTPRIALITGKSNRSYLKEFKSTDLMNISRVIVDMGNPITRTTAGRVNLAEQLIQNGLIASPEQYIQVLTTGRVESLYEAESSQLLLIKSENEKMQEGQNPLVLRTDNHELHIKEHQTVLSSPETRENPQIVQATLAHIAEHEQFVAQSQQASQQQADEQFRMQEFAKQQAKIYGAEAKEQIEGKGQAPRKKAPDIGPSLDATNSVSLQAGEVALPRMPKNPLTDQ